jgi:hypothetical protein
VTGDRTRRTRRRRGAAAGAVALAAVLAASAAACGDDEDPAADVDVAALRDGLAEQARDTIAAALHENPGSREDLLAGVPEDEPELWDEINADGEITLEEFRSVRAVANAVNTYSGDIVGWFESEALDQAGAGTGDE